MKINTSQVEAALMNKAVSAYRLAKEIGIDQSAISRLRSGERPFKNLTVETIEKVQAWIDAGNYHFSYDYSDLIEELEEDIAENLVAEYIYIVRGLYNELLEKCPIVDYYYTAEEITEGDIAEKVLTSSVLAEMKADSQM